MAVLAAFLALVLGVAACGDSDDSESSGNETNVAQGQSEDGGDGSEDGGDGTTGSGSAATADGAAADSPKGQALAAYERFLDAFYAKDVDTACALLTQKGQRQWGGAEGGSCESELKTFLAPIQDLSASPRPRVIKLRVNGDRAVAMAVTGTKDDSTTPVPLVKEGGEWKVDAGGGL